MGSTARLQLVASRDVAPDPSPERAFGLALVHAGRELCAIGQAIVDGAERDAHGFRVSPDLVSRTERTIVGAGGAVHRHRRARRQS